MMVQLIAYFRITGVLLLWAVACGSVAIVFSASSFAVENVPPGGVRNTPPRMAAEPEGRNHQPLRIPPRQAIEACEGKREGDSCSFSTPRGVLNGNCLAGVENVFACRPHRGTSQSQTGSSRESHPPVEAAQPQPREKPEPAAVSNPESANPPVNSREAVRQTEPLPGSHPDPPPATSGSVPAAQPPQALPPMQEENHIVPPQPPITGLTDRVDRYAGGIGACLVTAILAAGLTWYRFFRYSTVPLRILRKVTQQLAGGDLSARVGEGLVRRKDEVANLGRDVDRMAERIESLVGAHQRLIRDVSHELRSPLARLNVALELARQSAGAVNSAPFDRIGRESDRLNELIGHLLMLTKLESGSGMNQRSDIDIKALIEEVANDADFEAKSCDRRVRATAGEVLVLNGNKELLRQALENVVRNAARYTAEGPEVEISLRKKESGGRLWAHIEVRDQGPGVPESELYDIFRPFYRVNDARERQSGGAGVGLAISDRAIRLHGGSLRAFNAPGGGLIMEMELPLT